MAAKKTKRATEGNGHSATPITDAQIASIMAFVNDHGETLSKTNTPVNASLEMHARWNGYVIRMSAYAHGMGNGSYELTVKEGRRTVFRATGCYTAGPFDSEVERYQPGSWTALCAYRSGKRKRGNR